MDHTGNAEHKGNGVTSLPVPMMTVTVDPRTMAVMLDCSPAPIFFWQMVVDEVRRQLEEQRRLAAAVQLKQQLLEQEQNARIAAAVRGNRG